MKRVLAGHDVDVESPVFYAGETATEPTSPAVTVDREDGTSLVAPSITAGGADGKVTVTLAAGTHTSRLDVLTLTWTGTVSGKTQRRVQYVEVVGGLYAELGELRALRNLSDDTKFTSAEFDDARTAVEDLVEIHTGVAWVPRYHRDRLEGRGHETLWLSRRYPREDGLLAVTIDGTALTSADWAGWTVADHGTVVRDNGIFDVPSVPGELNVSIAYQHGHDLPPEELRQAALTAMRAKLLADQSGLPSRELSIRTETGDRIFIAQPGTERPTGMPEVDAVLNRYRIRMPGIA